MSTLGGQIAGAGGFVAVQGGEALDDLRAAAMAVHVAEAADVHEHIEAEGGSGVEGAEGFVVAAAVAQAELDDLVDAGGGQAGDEVADLAVGVVAGGVEQRGGQLDFKGFGALDQIDHCVRQAIGGSGARSSAAAWASQLAGFDLVGVGLGVFDQRGGGADFAGEEAGGFGGERPQGMAQFRSIVFVSAAMSRFSRSSS